MARCINPVIINVYPGSIAEELGLEPGDKIIKINGTIIEDQLDFRFLQADEKLIVEVVKSNGETWILDVEKEQDEELGVEFKDATFDGIKQCRNKCVFCFVDQMPDNMRRTLYIKDDDYRHSFLFGNFITLTNLSTKELNKIVAMKLSPLYVSIHTTNPELRKKLLNNKNAGKVLEQLQYLTQNGICIHGQIVLVPGLNDGKELKRTIEDLSNLMPQMKSLAVVPVGLTKHRQDLPELQPFTKEKAVQVIDLIAEYQKKFLEEYRTRFVFAADEFYILAEREIPTEEFYEGYPQLENGIGIVRILVDEFYDLYKLMPEQINDQEPRLLVTSTSGYKVISPLVKELQNRYHNLKVKLVAVPNDYFGTSVTVTGLLTGQDILKTLKKLNLAQNTTVIIPDIMLKDGCLFLDDLTLTDLEKLSGYKVKQVSTSGSGLIEAVTDIKF